MTATPVRPVGIEINNEIKERLKRLADARQRTPDWLMREAILQYVEREERRQTFRQDAIDAWNEYQPSGLHVSKKEADAWFEKLEAGEDTEPPEGQD
jgi:predicted transcriptional regulator